jgi:hypothetical protein
LKRRPALQSFDAIQKKKDPINSRKYPRTSHAPQLPAPLITDRKSSMADLADSAWAMLDSLEFTNLDLSLDNNKK